MKALKGKRNSLRSLWRMGLVILSVFTLMLAACGDSSTADPVTPPLPPPAEVLPGGNPNPEPPTPPEDCAMKPVPDPLLVNVKTPGVTLPELKSSEIKGTKPGQVCIFAVALTVTCAGEALVLSVNVPL